MKKKKTRFLALLLSALLTAAALTGCTNSGSGTSSATNSSSTEESISSDAGTSSTVAAEAGEVALPIVDEPVTVTMWSPSAPDLTTIVDSYADTAFFKRLAEETNVTIDFDMPALGNESQAFSLMIASNELPDMIRTTMAVQYPGGLDAAIDDGYFLDLTDMIPELAPNYLKALERMDEFDLNIRRSAVTPSGRYGGICQLMYEPQGAYGGMYVRQDWLDELEMDTPQTYEDWETMLTAFKDEMGATAPLLLYKTGYEGDFNSLSVGYGVTSSFYQEDGVVKFGPAEEGWREYVTTMHDWYEKGLIDPDFMSSTSSSPIVPDTAMVTTGKAGAFAGMYISVAMWEESNTDPDAVYSPVYPPMQEAGEVSKFGNMPLAGAYMAISAKSEHAETCLKLMDYFFSDAGYIDCNYGVEGETFEYVDGEPQFTELVTANDEMTFAQAYSYYTVPPAWPVYQDWRRELASVPEKDVVCYDVWSSFTKENSMPRVTSLGMTQEDNVEYSRLMTDIQSIVDEKTAQFISGAVSLDEYDAYLQQLDQMGLADAITIVQNAYDSFMARDVG